MLFSSHVMQEVSALCDSIVVVAGGRVVAHGTPDELRAQGGHENLEDAFVALAGTADAESAGDDARAGRGVRPWWCWSRSSWTRSATSAR